MTRRQAFVAFAVVAGYIAIGAIIMRVVAGRWL
jgi:hypothetical protein